MFVVAKRVALFLLTNLAVLIVLGTVVRLLGLDAYLQSQGIPLAGLLAIATVFGFGGSFISLALSKPMARWSTGARIIVEPTTRTEAWLVATVARQAEAAGIGRPDVAIYPSPVPNAFATGMSSNHALVAVSDGLLQSMSMPEVEAVLAHEISHVANGDMVTMALLQGVVNTFVIFLARVVGYIVDRTVLGGGQSERRGVGAGYYLTTMVMEIFLGVLASLIVAWYSRRREFRADAGSARIEGPAKMIAALQTLDMARGAPALPQAMAAFGIRGASPRWLQLFATHPPIAERIAALERALR